MQRPDESLTAHHTWLRRVARRIARSSASADDLVQDTYMVALQNAPADAEMRPWLRSVMRKLAWGHSRAETRRTRREEVFHHYARPSAEPDPLLKYGVDRQHLAEVLARVPEPFRSTLVQRYIEDRSCTDIARDEKVPAATVRSRQARGLAFLRAELERQRTSGARTRRARILWLVPVIGIQRAAATMSQSLLALSGKAKLAGLVLVGLAVAFGIHLLDTPEQTPLAHPGADALAAAGPHAPSAYSHARAEMQRAGRTRLARPLTALLAHQSAGDPADPTRMASAGGGNEQRAGTRGHGTELDGHPAAQLLEDCWIDERDEVRCRKPPMTPTIPGRPTCDFLNRNLAIIDITRSTQLMNISYANRFLTAALLANMTMATNMGCQLYSDGPDGSGPADYKELPADGEISCVTREGKNGGVCTTCIDAEGQETTMCAPADCYTEDLPDGSLCVTCADESGTSYTECHPASSCSTYIYAHRFICTSCDGDAPECAPAQCTVDEAGCQTCVDASGRSVTECGKDVDCTNHPYRTSPDSGTICETNTCPDGTLTHTCHYPGPDTCDIYDYGKGDGVLCLVCDFPSGGMGDCSFDVNNPPPDPMAGRPADLPAPGTCVTESSPGGFWSCTTCTAEDGYANRTCSYDAAGSCTSEVSADQQMCSTCTYPDSSVARVCFSGGAGA